MSFFSDFNKGLSFLPGGGMLGNIFGIDNAAASEQEAAARKQMEAELARQQGLMPSEQDLTARYALGDPNAFLLGPSQAAGAEADPNSIAGQQSALAALQNVYNSKGMTDADKAYMQQAQAQNARALRGKNDATMQNMAERGMGGSGAQLGALLSNQSQLANANAATGAEMGYNAQNRALQAMQAAGGLSSDMRGQSFNETFSRGSAADRFNMANTQRQQNVYDNNLNTYNAMEDSRIDAKKTRYGYETDVGDKRLGIYGADQTRAQGQQDAAQAQKKETEKKVASAITGGRF